MGVPLSTPRHTIAETNRYSCLLYTSLFNDFGRLVNNNSYNGELTSENLASCGLGYNYYDKDNGWFGTLSYAKIYDDLDSYQSHAHRPWQVSLTK